MADNAPNPVEQLLQRYAQQRRQQAGAPFELHPADRRRLQEEVARQYGAGKTTTPKSAGSWLVFLPRLGMALGLFAVLALVAWSVWLNNHQPAGSPQDFAKNNAPVNRLTPPAKPANVEARIVRTLDTNLGLVKAVNVVDNIRPDAVAPTPKVSEPLPPPAPRALPAENSFGRTLGEEVKLEEATRNAQALAEQAKQLAAEAELRQVALKRSFSMQDKAVARRSVTDAPAAMPPPAAPAPVQAADQKLSFANAQAAQRGITEYYFGLAKDARADQSDALAPGVMGGGMTERPSRFAPEPARDKAEAGKELKALEGADANRDHYAILAAEADAKAKADTASQVLLAAFDVEIAANRIRIIDTDGSIYEGVLEARPVAAAPAPSRAMKLGAPAGPNITNSRGGAGGARLETARALNALGDGQVQNVPMSFQATGTSRRLGQPVTINGTWTGAANLAVQTQRERENLVRREAGAAGAALTLAAPVNKISGFVRIGGGPERPLNAVQVKK